MLLFSLFATSSSPQMENQLELCFHEEPPNCNLDEVFQQVIKLQKYNV